MIVNRLPLTWQSWSICNNLFFSFSFDLNKHTHDLFSPQLVKPSRPSHLQGPRIFNPSSTKEGHLERCPKGPHDGRSGTNLCDAHYLQAEVRWHRHHVRFSNSFSRMVPQTWGCALAFWETVLRIINDSCYGQWMGSHNISLPIIDNVQFDH